jgi:hypothetical protein
MSMPEIKTPEPYVINIILLKIACYNLKPPSINAIIYTLQLLLSYSIKGSCNVLTL